MDVVNWLIENGPEIVGAVLTIIGGFAVLAKLTPNKHDDLVAGLILTAINVIGMNFGNTKNKDD